MIKSILKMQFSKDGGQALPLWERNKLNIDNKTT